MPHIVYGLIVAKTPVVDEPLPDPAPAPPPARNVLVFHSGALGDFILTWPILLGTARMLAQCRVIAIVDGDKGKLAEQVLRVEHRDVESAGWSSLHAGHAPPERATHLLAGARQIISFVGGSGSLWDRTVRRLAPQARLTYLDSPPRKLTGMHASQFLLDQFNDDPLLHAGTAGIIESLGKSGLLPRMYDATGPILLHPGSGSAKKNWPMNCWLELAGRLRKEGRRVRIILGEVERERMDSQAVAAFEEVADVQRPADLSELLFLLRGAGGYIGHDTGPTHLAAAIGLPTTVLFGPASDPAVWAPLGPRVRIMHTEDFATMSPDEVQPAEPRP